MRFLLLLGLVGGFWHFATGGSLGDFSKLRFGARAQNPQEEIARLEQLVSRQQEAVTQFRYAIGQAQAVTYQAPIVQKNVGGSCGRVVGTETRAASVCQSTYDQLRAMEQQLADSQYQLRVALAKAAQR